MPETPPIDRSGRLNTERREIILDAARAVFDEKGLQGASLRTIAKAANCTTGAIYPYFSGKEEIYAEILRRSLVSLQNHIHPPDSASVPAEQRFLRFLEFYDTNPADFALGLYLYDQGAPIGVGAELNTVLNQLLIQAVRLVAYDNLHGHGHKEDEALMLAALMGIIISNSTNRFRLFDTDFQKIGRLTFNRLKSSGLLFS